MLEQWFSWPNNKLYWLFFIFWGVVGVVGGHVIKFTIINKVSSSWELKKSGKKTFFDLLGAPAKPSPLLYDPLAT